MFFEKIVAAVKAFVSSDTPGEVTEVDLVHCPGKIIEVTSEDGLTCQIAVDESVKAVDDQFVDNVRISHMMISLRPAVVQRRIHVGRAMRFSDTVHQDWFAGYDVVPKVARITVSY